MIEKQAHKKCTCHIFRIGLTVRLKMNITITL